MSENKKFGDLDVVERAKRYLAGDVEDSTTGLIRDLVAEILHLRSKAIE